jgi:hypothetical protein
VRREPPRRGRVRTELLGRSDSPRAKRDVDRGRIEMHEMHPINRISTCWPVLSDYTTLREPTIYQARVRGMRRATRLRLGTR